LHALLIWLAGSLLAIALMGRWPPLALAVVLAGGMAMGLSCLGSDQTRGRDGSRESSPTAGGE